MTSPTPMLEFLVETDVALARPPRVHARTWTWVAVADRGPDADPMFDRAATEARLIAAEIAATHPRVVMPLGSRVLAAVL